MFCLFHFRVRSTKVVKGEGGRVMSRRFCRGQPTKSVVDGKLILAVLLFLNMIVHSNVDARFQPLTIHHRIGRRSVLKCLGVHDVEDIAMVIRCDEEQWMKRMIVLTHLEEC